MGGTRANDVVRRFAVALLTAMLIAAGLIGMGATPASAAVATPYIFAPPNAVVGEASGSVTLPVTLSEAGLNPVTVTYNVPGGGCNNPNQAKNGMLTFAPGVLTQNVSVTINNCNVNAKSFFTMTLSAAGNGVIAQATTQVDVIGNNNPKASPGLYARNAVVDTSAGSIQVPVLLGGPAGETSTSPVTVHYATADGSAVAGVDYTSTSGNLTFAAGQTAATVPVTITKRGTPAAMRSFSVVLSAPTSATIINGTGVVTIGASGGSKVATPFLFAPPDTVVGAVDGWIDLPVTLSAPSDNLVTVAYNVVGGNCNYLSQGASGTLSFTPGVVLKVIRMQINDCKLATKSLFTLNLTAATNSVIAQATTQVDGVGDPTPLGTTPGLYVKNAVVDTSAGSVQVPVLLGGPAGATSFSTVTVHYATANGSALSGTDYEVTSGTLTFGPGQTAQTVTVPIVKRTAPTARSFSLVLSAPTNAAIINGTGVVTIGASGGTNVATPYVFAPPDTVVGAVDGWVDLPVKLSAPSLNLVTVAYNVVGGNCNYLSQGASGTLSFTPGVVLKVIRMQINDCKLATKSFFTLTLAPPVGTSMNAVIAQATTQVDGVGDPNPEPTPGLFVKNAVVDTSAGSVQVPVLLGGAAGATSASTVTVHYATANLSAVSGADYTAVSGTLTYGPGQTVATVTVPIINRASAAGVRSFAVVLSAPTNAAIVIGSGVATIGASGGANVATPGISAPAAQTVSADEGWIDLRVSLSAKSASLVTVHYGVVGGGCNYLAQGVAGTLSFVPGVTTQVIRVQINDCLLTTVSTFTLTLSAPTGGATITNATTVVSTPPVSYTTNYTAAEQPRVVQSANYMGVTPQELQRTGILVLIYIVNTAQPRPTPTAITPPPTTGPVSYTTTWTASDIGLLRQMQAQYLLTPEQTQKWGVQVVNYLLLAGGH